jgi:hypothetical protein
MTAGIEAPAKEAKILLNTNESVAVSATGYATLTFSMVFHLPEIEAKTSLVTFLYGKFHAKL